MGPALHGKQQGQRLEQFRRFGKLLRERLYVHRRLLRLFLRRLHGSEIGVCIERGLKSLSIDLTVLLQDVGIDFGNHIEVGMAGVSLRRLQVAVIEFQLIGRAGMPEAVEHDAG